MFDLLPFDIIFEIALLLDFADIATLVSVLAGQHQQAVIGALKSTVLRHIVSHATPGILFNAHGRPLAS